LLNKHYFYPQVREALIEKLQKHCKIKRLPEMTIAFFIYRLWMESAQKLFQRPIRVACTKKLERLAKAQSTIEDVADNPFEAHRSVDGH